MKVCKLSDIAEVQTGPFGSQLHSEDYVEEGTPIVTVEHLGNRRFTIQNLPFVSNEDRERLSKYSLREGDIVFSRVGAVDRCSYVTSDENGWLFSGRCLRVRCHHECDALYLYYYFCSDSVKEYVRSKAVGATMLSLNTDLMLEIPIQFPQIKLQKEIAKTLSFLDSKIELNRQINDNLEAMAKQLYDYWFVQFDFPNEEGKPYKSSGGAMVYNEKLKREIPQGWHCYELNKWLEIKSGFAFKSETYISKGKFKVVTIKNVQDHHLDTSSCDYVYEIPQGMKKWCSLSVNDRLISLTGNCGRLCIVTEKDLLLNQRVGLLACNDEYIDYAYLLLSSEEYQTLSNNLAKGAAQANLSPVDLCKNIAVLPKLDVLEKFNRQIKPIVASYIQNEIQIAELTKQRDELLPLLMNGQASVNYHLSSFPHRSFGHSYAPKSTRL